MRFVFRRGFGSPQVSQEVGDVGGGKSVKGRAVTGQAPYLLRKA